MKRRLFAGLALLLTGGCALSTTYVDPVLSSRPAAPVPADAVDHRLILVGDAGDPRHGSEPVLVAMEDDARRFRDRCTVVFLGDNIYPAGFRDVGDEDHEESRRRLRVQVEAVVRSGAEGLFVAGNHDYRAGVGGLLREAELIEADGEGRVRYVPSPGCPGPLFLERGGRLELALIDSVHWIEGFETVAGCDPATLEEGLRRLASPPGDGRHRVVLAHHPLTTHGKHGGFFTWQHHLFPLQELWDWAWIPLPVVGSLYPAARWLGVTSEDLSSREYQRFVERMDMAFRLSRPLVFAAGHEHCLQVLRRETVPYVVVSGAGSVSRPDPVSRGDDTLVASPFAGYVCLDFLGDGCVRLEIVEVREAGGVRRPFAMWLNTGAPCAEHGAAGD